MIQIQESWSFVLLQKVVLPGELGYCAEQEIRGEARLQSASKIMYWWTLSSSVHCPRLHALPICFRPITEADLQSVFTSVNLGSCELDPLPPFIISDRRSRDKLVAGASWYLRYKTIIRGSKTVLISKPSCPFVQ